jgi:hypothetical protein
MSKKEFDAFLNSCYAELQEKQDILINQSGLMRYEDFLFDQTTRSIQFKNNGEVGLEFSVVLVGSWSSKSNSWMWAWANESVENELRVETSRIRELAELTGNSIFTEEKFKADEMKAHELTSMAVHHLDALGMYIIPTEGLKSFLALMKKL